jgi:hypothetical protein
LGFGLGLCLLLVGFALEGCVERRAVGGAACLGMITLTS